MGTNISKREYFEFIQQQARQGLQGRHKQLLSFTSQLALFLPHLLKQFLSGAQPTI